MTESLKLGKYTLYEVLGSGAFGTVYRATDGVGRTVALKVLKPMLSSDPAIVARFQQEARQTGELFHARIASILDFDEADGRVFFAMRYIAGESLDRKLKRGGALAYADATTIFAQAAEALDYAHARGLVHRDVKPANIILGAEGAVLTDFGLVRAATSSGLSTSSAMIGTPSYMPPEVWDGSGTGPQTDVYALGCVLYEMLTGQVLFGGDTTPVIMKKHFSPLRLPESWPEGVPAGLGELLRAMLAPDLGDRPASTGECVRRLKVLETPAQAAVAEPAPSGPPAGMPTPRLEAEPANVAATTAMPVTAGAASQKAATGPLIRAPVRAAEPAKVAEPKEPAKPTAVPSPELKVTATAAATAPDATPVPKPQVLPSPSRAAADQKATGDVLGLASLTSDPGSGLATVDPNRNAVGGPSKPAPAGTGGRSRRWLGLTCFGLGAVAVVVFVVIPAMAFLASHLTAPTYPAPAPTAVPSANVAATAVPPAGGATPAPMATAVTPQPLSGKGTVLGQIRWNDQPLPEISVELLAGVCCSVTGTVTARTVTDAMGNYRFDNVDARADYTIGTNGFPSEAIKKPFASSSYSWPFTLAVGETSKQDRDIEKTDLVVISPTKDSQTVQVPTFAWATYPGAAYYLVTLVRPDPTFERIFMDVKTTTTNLVSPKILTKGTAYYGTVYSYNANGTAIAWGEIPQFMVKGP